MRYSLLLWALVLGGVAFRFERLWLGFPLWGDEAFVAINLLERGFGELLGRLEYDMVVPPATLLLMWASEKLAPGTEWALRLPAFLAGLAAFLVFARFALTRLPRSTALFAVTLFAVAYYPMRYGAEVKPYAFDLLAGAVLITLWTPARGARVAPVGRAPRIVLAALLVWTSYPAVFVIGGLLVAGVLCGEDRTSRARLARQAALDGALIAASFLAMYFLHGRAQQWGEADFAGHAQQWVDDFPPLSTPWRIPWWLFLQHAGYMSAVPVGGSGFGSIGSLALVVIGLVTARRGPWPFLRTSFVSALALMLLASAFRLYPYGGSLRTCLHLVPWISLFMAAGLSRATLALRRRRGRVRTARLAIVGLFVVLAVALAARDARHPYKHRYDAELRAAVRELGRRSSSSERFVLFGHLGDAGPPAQEETGPDLYAWRSGVARLRAYVHLVTGRSATTTAELRSVTSPDLSPLWVLGFEDPHAVMDWTAFDAQVAALGDETERLELDLTSDQRLRAVRVRPAPGR